MADAQLGVVSRGQLRAMGFFDDQIVRMHRSGRLHRLHRGVYAVGHPALRLEGRLIAATLAAGTGTGAVVSHRSAAHLWDLRRSDQTRVDITILRTGRRRIPGVHLHCTRRLAEGEITTHRGVPVTTVSRTLADLASVLRANELSQALERAYARRILDVAELRRSSEHRRGAAALRRLLDGWAPKGTKSELERRLLTLIRRSALPAPEVNSIVFEYEVDLLWRSARVVVEADSQTFHATPAAMERDRRRDAVLVRHGYQVLRVTWNQVSDRPAEVIHALRALLARSNTS